MNNSNVYSSEKKEKFLGITEIGAKFAPILYSYNVITFKDTRIKNASADKICNDLLPALDAIKKSNIVAPIIRKNGFIGPKRLKRKSAQTLSNPIFAKNSSSNISELPVLTKFITFLPSIFLYFI